MLQTGRASVLEDFWLTRQGLDLPESARPKSAPTFCRGNDRYTSTPRDEQARDMKSPRGKVGVLECIDGVLRGATLGALDSIVNVPVLLVTSTLDALDSSNTAKVSRRPNLAEERNIERKHCFGTCAWCRPVHLQMLWCSR